MARARGPADRERDLAASRKIEAWVAERLRESPLVSGLEDHRAELERLDFSFDWAGERVWLGVKER